MLDSEKPNELLVAFQSSSSFSSSSSSLLSMEVVDIRNTRFSSITGKQSPSFLSSCTLQSPIHAPPISMQPFFSDVSLLPSIVNTRRMTCFRRYRMDPSRCSIAIPERFVSSRTSSAASPNTPGMALFLAHSAPASWAICSGCLRSCDERKAFRSSTSSRSLGSKSEARLA